MINLIFLIVSELFELGTGMILVGIGSIAALASVIYLFFIMFRKKK